MSESDRELFHADDRRYMARALRLADRGLYTTDPNPRVGCVLVRDGQIVGEGWHRKTGEPHAERLALAEARSKAEPIFAEKSAWMPFSTHPSSPGRWGYLTAAA